MSDGLVVYGASALRAQDVVAQVSLIQEVMRDVMKEGIHYGVVPGCGDKPTLLKPGAEKLAFVFRLRAIIDPRQDVVVHEVPGLHLHREVSVTCHLKTWDDIEVATGLGSCSTMETKYRYRNSERVCPSCGKSTIIKGKPEYAPKVGGGRTGKVQPEYVEGGWLCYRKKGGCGAQFPDKDKSIIDQQVGQSENEALADTFNTILKMAKKRSFVDAVLTGTAASDFFTQDIEDLAGLYAAEVSARRAEEGAGTAQERIDADTGEVFTDDPDGRPEMVGRSGFATEQKFISDGDLMQVEAALNDCGLSVAWLTRRLALRSLGEIPAGATSKVLQIIRDGYAKKAAAEKGGAR